MGFARYVIVDRARLEAAIQGAVQAAVEELLEGSSPLHLPESEVEGARPVSRGQREEERHPVPEGKYRIGTAADEHSYADVIDERMEKHLFNQDDAARVVEDYVVGLSPRFRDSMRRSLDNDERFVRVSDEDKEGIWWERRTAEQLPLDDD